MLSSTAQTACFNSIGCKVAKILLVEDDPTLAKQVKDWLELEHHQVEVSGRGLDAIERLKFFQFDLVLLDWNLPERNGIEILTEFRNAGGTTPVIMLTTRDSITDKESGLGIGADDYLTKPFHLRELAARVAAIVRRQSRVYGGVLKIRDIELDATTRLVTRNGAEIKLQPQEFAVFEFFLRNPKEIYSLDTLLGRLWPSDSDASPETVRVCITRLRSKLESTDYPSVIKTVHRVGYQLDPGT